MWLIVYFVVQCMFISNKKNCRLVVCRYQSQYGPNDLPNLVKDITQNHNATPKELDINGKVIPLRIGHKGTQDSKKKWSGSIKKGCRA